MGDETNDQEGSRRALTGRERAALVLVLLLGVLVRGLYLGELAQSPDFRHPAIDAGFHDDWARSLAVPGWTPRDYAGDPRFEASPYLRPPGYPFFLAGVYAVFGDGYLAPRIVQMLMGLGTAVLAFWVGRRWFDGVTGVIFAALVALNWLSIYFEGELHAPALASLLLLAVLAAFGMWADTGKARHALLAGLGIGLASLVRPNILLFLPVGLAWLAWVARRRASGPSWLRAAGCLILGTALAVAPATIRNLRVADDFVLISSNGGINLYMGNNDAATGFVAQQIPGLGDFGTCYDYPALVESLEDKLQRELRHSEVSAWFAAEAWRWITANPGDFLRLTAHKALLLFGPIEVSHNKVIELERRNSATLRRTPGGFGQFLSLAAVGLVLWTRFRGERGTSGHERAGRELGLLALALAATFMLSILPFFVAARYRVPVLPYLGLLGALGIRRWIEWVRARSWLPAAVSLLAAGLFYGGLTWNAAEHRPNRAKWHSDRGRAHNHAGESASAVVEYRAALALRPDSAGARYGLAVALTAEGDRKGAIEHLQEVAAANPDHVRALTNLGSIFGQMGQFDRAVHWSQRAIEADPESEVAHRNLAMALRGLGRLEEALTALRQALALTPGSASAHHDLGRGLSAVGLHSEAEEHLRRAVTLDPHEPRWRADLALLLASCPDEQVRDGAEALALAAALCEGAGATRAELLGVLAAAYAETGQFERAVATAERAIGLAESRGQASHVRALRPALQLYRTGRPWRSRPPPGSPRPGPSESPDPLRR